MEKFLSGLDIRLSKDRINCGGGNYGELEVLDNIVRFSSENRCDHSRPEIFELNQSRN